MYKDKIYQYELVKQWRKEHPEYHKEYNKKYRRNKPWVKFFSNAHTHCHQIPSYIKHGIKVFLSVKVLEFLWFRDKAFLMEKPCLHRINSFNDYCVRNCEFLEKKNHLSICARKNELLRVRLRNKLGRYI